MDDPEALVPAPASGRRVPQRAVDATILQITPTSYAREGVIGGGERLAIYIDEALARAARARGLVVETAVLSLDAAAPRGAAGDRHQAIAGRAWDARSLAADDLIRRLRRAQIVYVHQCLTQVGLFAAAHARLLGKRVYGSDAGAGEALILRNSPETVVIYDGLHAISSFAASAYSGFPVPVHVIAGPVDTELHRPPTGAAADRDPRLVVSVGRILPHKGHDRTIDALPEGLSLAIVGQVYDQAYFAHLQDRAAGKDVRFLHELDDSEVRALLHRARLFVHASTHVDHLGRFYHKPELLGLAPLEALACGLVTLVSDAGSLPELGDLPGCHVFESDAGLAAMLQAVAAGQAEQPEPDIMHDAVARRYGLLTVGGRLLDMMGVAPACAS